MNFDQLLKAYSPFKPEVHPEVDSAQKHTIEWATRFQIIENDVTYDRFYNENSAWLAGRTFIDAGLEELCIAGDWCSWLFLFDDQCDNQDLGRQPDKLRKILDAFIDILEQDRKVTLKNGSPFEASLSDFWERARAKATHHWIERYRNSLIEYFHALHWESKNRKQKKYPSVKSYIQHRIHSGAVYTVIDLADVVENLSFSQEVLNDPTFNRLRYLANVISCWFNDVLSYEKEKSHNDYHNLVLTLENEKNIPVEEAITEAIRIHDQDVEEFIQLEKKIPSFGTQMDDHIGKYLSVLRSWIRGHVDWSFNDTSRFTIYK
ncbi:terpene synthase family protein [Seinonella peptonophila]|nr:hypothetical protein [Seinonella peptonophila]